MNNTNGHDKVAYLHNSGARSGRSNVTRLGATADNGRVVSDAAAAASSGSDKRRLKAVPLGAEESGHVRRSEPRHPASINSSTNLPQSETGRLLGALGLAVFTAIAVVVIYQVVT